MSKIDKMTDNHFKGLLGIIAGIGGKRWIAYIITTLIFIFMVNKDQFTFGTYVMFVMAWASLETKKRGGE